MIDIDKLRVRYEFDVLREGDDIRSLCDELERTRADLASAHQSIAFYEAEYAHFRELFRKGHIDLVEELKEFVPPDAAEKAAGVIAELLCALRADAEQQRTRAEAAEAELREALRDYNKAGGSGVRESAYAGEQLALAISRCLNSVAAEPVRGQEQEDGA